MILKDTSRFCSQARVWAMLVVAVVVAAPLSTRFQPGLLAAEPPASGEKTLFDFESDDEVKTWTPLAIPGSKLPGTTDPAPTVARATQDATSKQSCLKVTFNGGRWPTVTTMAVPVTENWVSLRYQTFRADVTVSRPCLVGFRVLMENRPRDNNYTWAKTQICTPGKNEIVATLGGWWTGMETKDGKITALDFFVYNAHQGESVFVDNIRLSPEKAAAARKAPSFQVLGTDYTVTGLPDLAKKLKDEWKMPVEKPIEQVEAEFKVKYEALKAVHPKAVLAILRDGEKGWDPANPDTPYKGWMQRHVNSHGPDSNIVEIAANNKGWGSLECFMRHRSLLLRADLSIIPKGSAILAANFVLTRTGPLDPKSDRTCLKPNMWVAEACNRPWVETEVNGYEYARDKFWKTVGGMGAESYEGADPDFLPIYIAHGPSTGVVNVWDFTDAVKFWLDGAHPNHGFFFHGDSTDYIMTFTYECKDVKQRPAIMVIYEPK